MLTRLLSTFAAVLFWPSLALAQAPPPPPPPPPPPVIACPPLETIVFFDWDRASLGGPALEILERALTLTTSCKLASISIAGLGGASVKNLTETAEFKSLPASEQSASVGYRLALISRRTEGATRAFEALGVPADKLDFAPDADPRTGVRLSAGDVAAGFSAPRAPAAGRGDTLGKDFDRVPLNRRVEIALEFE